MGDEKCLDMSRNNQWVDGNKVLENLTNSRKRFHFKLAPDVIEDMKKIRDADKVLLCRKAMIGCGMALNLNWLREFQQVFPHLQEII